MINYEVLKSWPIAPVTQTYSVRDTLLYALGVGAALPDPLDSAALPFLYERDLLALPSMAIVLATPPFWVQDPATGIDWKKMLHAEQSLEMHKPLPTSGKVIGREAVVDIIDKGPGKAALLILRRTLEDAETGELIAVIGTRALLRGDGGFGGPSTGAPVPHALPEDRSPDIVIDLGTRPEQALIYSMSGDRNPLHIDPDLARAVGFDRPILHGLCSYGVALRAALSALCANQPARLKRFDVRFVSPVYPGETLRTEIWKDSTGRASLRVRIVERDVVALSNGYVEYEPE